jgi:hypothetical protein
LLYPKDGVIGITVCIERRAGIAIIKYKRLFIIKLSYSKDWSANASAKRSRIIDDFSKIAI